MTKLVQKLVVLSAVALLGIVSCSDIIMEEAPQTGRGYMNNPLGMGQIHITTEPDGAKIMLVSMGSRQMQTFYAPADINYMITPAMPTVLTIAKKGYKPKTIRLDGKKKEMHVTLDKAPLMPMIDFGGAGRQGGPGRGRPSDIGIGGAMGPAQDIVPRDQGGQ